MTSVPLKHPLAPSVPERIVALFDALATRFSPLRSLVVLWALLTFPLVFFRGYNSDEGLAVSIARTAIEHGEWLVPRMFNVRWVERPTLLAWIIALVSEPFGAVTQVSSRVPVIFFVLLGCVLIFLSLRRVCASVSAALFGALLFLACPIVIRSYSLITSDLPLAVLLFLSFFLWWDGHRVGRISVSRWIAIGVVLALSALMKGPQPLAYFGLGVGLYVLIGRQWQQIPGFAFATIIAAIPVCAWYAAVFVPGDERVWGAYMRLSDPNANFAGPAVALARLLSEIFPAALAAAALLAARRFPAGSFVPPRRFILALACYAFPASVLVLFWPGGSATRYYFPMFLPLCVFGGMAYDLLRGRRPQIVAALLLITLLPLVYALGYAAASPFFPMQFRKAQLQGSQVAELVRTAPGPIYRTGDVALNVLPYVPGRIIGAGLGELLTAQAPGWMVLTAEDSESLIRQRPKQLTPMMSLGDREQWRLLRLEK